MPQDPDRLAPMPLRGPLARLNRSRDELAKGWIVRLIERSSLEEIKEMPTDRIASELPELISDLLGAAAADGDAFAIGAAGRERAARLADLRQARDSGPEDLARDVATIQAVIVRALARDSDDLDGAEVADLAARLAEATAAVQGAAVDALVGRRARELESLANTDPLTGLANLRHLRSELEGLLAAHKRYQHPFALLVLDLDGLKRVNDAQGHQAGDRVLVTVALAMRRQVRSVDIPARIGGDEFCVLAPHQTAASARVLGDRLAAAVEADTATRDGPAVGVSIGVVSCPEHGEDAEALLEMADQAMYRAKAGGEKVALGDPDEPELIKVEKTKK